MKKLFLGWLAGFLGHFAFYDVIQKRASLPDLYSYVCGLLIVRAVFAYFARGLGAVHAFDQAAGAVGSGVVSARLVRLVMGGE